MSNIFHRVFALAVMTAALGGCEFWNRSVQDVLNNPFKSASVREPAPLRMPSSVVVCRTKQCAPAKLSMSREYIYNSLLHLLDNNNRKKALVCQADAGTHACTETFVSLPITVGITPAYMYIDSVKITDVSIAKGNRSLNLILNYNVTYNGQTPDCKPAKSLLYVKNVNNIVLEDSGYMCRMTSIGQTMIKTLFVIDYIDLDYGYIGGFYSVGLSGPAYGGGTGYMLIRLPKDAYPLSPELTSAAAGSSSGNAGQEYINASALQINAAGTPNVNANVQVFPIKK